MAFAAIALSTVLYSSRADAGAACQADGIPKRFLGICQSPLFKAYVACVEGSIPRWDPKENALRKDNLSPKNLVLAVLKECHPIAVKFGNKYGDDLADVLQSVANLRVSSQYRTAPLASF
jgi:hypothetical protein